jgi:hypothetical protein
VLVEPPRPHVRYRATTSSDGRALTPSGPDLRHGAAAAAATVALLSTGDVVLLAVLLGLASGDLVATAAVSAAGLSVAFRWGSTSLDAIAGAQSVLGPGGAVGSGLAATAAWCAAAALVLASPRGWRAPAFGLAAALCVAGPAAAEGGDLALRVAAGAVGVGLAVLAGRILPRAAARPSALGFAVVAGVLAVAA